MAASVFNVLTAIREGPGLYVGGSDSDRIGQLRTLEILMHGYAMAVHQHGVSDEVEDFNRAFGNYLHRRFGWPMSTGPVAALLEIEADHAAAWERYWILVDDFRRALGGET